MIGEAGLVIVLGLAAFRFWVLVASDSITTNARSRLPARMVNFLACPWCAGFWIAVIVYAVWRTWSDIWWVAAIIIIFAIAGLVGALGVWTGKEDDG